MRRRLPLPIARSHRLRCDERQLHARSSRTRPPTRHGVLILAGLAFSSACLAQSTDGPGEELQAVRARIQTLTSQLNESRSRQADVAMQLRDAEVSLSELHLQLLTIEIEMSVSKKQLSKLRREKLALKTQLREQRSILSRQIKASYALGKQDYLKLLLSQQDPTMLARTITYHDYFARSRASRIRQARERIRNIAEIERQVQSKARTLAELQTSKSTTKSRLENVSRQRGQLLAALGAKIKDSGERLAQLEQDEQRLADLLTGLREQTAAANAQDPPTGVAQSARQTTDDALTELTATESIDKLKPFSTLKGDLSWPATGKIRNHFGRRKSGELRWQGILIDAPSGQPVFAVSHGRVAFADWLRGFGLLLIIDHGQGYMSLYGHNQSLYKEIGDWVEGGELVSSAGDSGGNSDSGLYFEIRHNGVPENPLEWCAEDGQKALNALVTR